MKNAKPHWCGADYHFSGTSFPIIHQQKPLPVSSLFFTIVPVYFSQNVCSGIMYIPACCTFYSPLTLTHLLPPPNKPLVYLCWHALRALAFANSACILRHTSFSSSIHLNFFSVLSVSVWLPQSLPVRLWQSDGRLLPILNFSCLVLIPIEQIPN